MDGQISGKEVENGSLEDEFRFQRGHFPLPGLGRETSTSGFLPQKQWQSEGLDWDFLLNM